MNIIVAGLILTGIVLSLPITIILLINDRAINSCARLLAIAFLSISCYALSHFLFLTKLILEVPAYYRLALPLCYLIAPCIYLYVISILSGEQKKKRLQWLHFLPAMVMGIDVIPWLKMGEGARFQAVEILIADPRLILHVAQGYIPIWIHLISRPVIGIIYIYFQFCYIYNAYRSRLPGFNSSDQIKIIKWVITLTIIELILYLSVAGFSIVMMFGVSQYYLLKIVYVPAVLMSLSFIMINLYLYFNPLLLYGYEFTAFEHSENQDEAIRADYSSNVAVDLPDDLRPKNSGQQICRQQIDPEGNYYSGIGLSPYPRAAIDDYRRCLEKDLIQHELFKKQGLTVHQLTKMCGLPSRALSFMLTHIYKKRFNDFINEYRINYVIQRMHEDDWRGITLEGLALEAGFSSRTTFFLAFKRIHQMSPSQYLSNLEKQLYRVAKG